MKMCIIEHMSLPYWLLGHLCCCNVVVITLYSMSSDKCNTSMAHCACHMTHGSCHVTCCTCCCFFLLFRFIFLVLFTSFSSDDPFTIYAFNLISFFSYIASNNKFSTLITKNITIKNDCCLLIKNNYNNTISKLIPNKYRTS